MPRRHRLERPFGRYLRAFERNFGAAVAGEIEPLHDCRVATRRLRELVTLVTAELGRKATRGTWLRLQQVGQALGTVREIDVAIELLEELTGDAQTPVDAPCVCGSTSAICGRLPGAEWCASWNARTRPSSVGVSNGWSAIYADP